MKKKMKRKKEEQIWNFISDPANTLEKLRRRAGGEEKGTHLTHQTGSVEPDSEADEPFSQPGLWVSHVRLRFMI